MTRVIKFRAWERQMKEMIPVYDIDFEHQSINSTNAWRKFHEVELMQFTGLKDGNGTEIYESDLLSDGVRTFKVVWSSDMCWMYLRDIDSRQTASLSTKTVPSLEVVGNIHENPELLDV